MPLLIAPPDWFPELVTPGTVVASDDDRMRLAIRLARENVLRGTGGPFGAVIFERATGKLVAAGVNSVVRLGQSSCHAEVMAIMAAQVALKSWTLHRSGMPEHELHTSCAPCAMCLGATLWSGVRRLVCAAAQEDAEALGFDEGPVFEESYQHLVRAGIEVVQQLHRNEAREVFALYKEQGGPIYNG